jgi:predicted peptidase
MRRTIHQGTICLLVFFILTAIMCTTVLAQSVSGASSRSSSATRQAVNAESADTHLLNVYAITRVFADGWKLSGVALQYDRNIREDSVSPADYAVKTDVAAQKITGVYTSTDAKAFAKAAGSGQYVILELSTDYVLPVAAPRPPRPPTGPPVAAGTGSPIPIPAERPETPKIDLSQNPEVVTKVGNISWDPAAHPSILVNTGNSGGGGKAVSVTQVGDIQTSDGMTLSPATTTKENFYSRNLIVDGFMKADYHDPANGNLKYNIHFPSNYDPAKKYPVVVFLVDSNAVVRGVHAEALTQGLGGVIWADENEMKNHEAIVVAPLPMGPLINEKYIPARRNTPSGTQSSPYLATLGLMDYLIANIPNIDKNRIYLTGQGEGARAEIKMLIDRPELFAAALLFAPDYDPAEISKIANDNVWIIASQGDDLSYPNMEACTSNLKAANAHISRAEWAGQTSAAQFDFNVKSMIAQGSNIKYSILKRGTVVPQGITEDSLNNRAYTWRIGYSSKSLRDWLLAQKK